MTSIFASWTVGAALLFSAIKNMTLIQLVKGEPGPGQPASIVDTANAKAGSSTATEPANTKTTHANTAVPATPGHYVNPLPNPGTTTGRIDQGQDFGGTGKILAIGNAVVTRTGAPGWPGGAGLEYKLLDGPRKGQCIYVYEGVKVLVRTGQRLRAGQPVGVIIPGTSTGIETGFSDCNGVPLSHGEYTEGLETRSGKGFAGFLKSLGRK